MFKLMDALSSTLTGDVAGFRLKETVYHVVSAQQGMVTGIIYRPGNINYLVIWPDHAEQEHAAYELTKAKPVDGVDIED